MMERPALRSIKDIQIDINTYADEVKEWKIKIYCLSENSDLKLQLENELTDDLSKIKLLKQEMEFTLYILYLEKENRGLNNKIDGIVSVLNEMFTVLLKEKRKNN